MPTKKKNISGEGSVVTPSKDKTSPQNEKKKIEKLIKQKKSKISKSREINEDFSAERISSSKVVTPSKQKDTVVVDGSEINVITPSQTYSQSSRNLSPPKSPRVSLSQVISAELNESSINKQKSKIKIDEKVKLVYKIIRKCTGSLGGNADGGAIYGELTVGSFQKVVDILIDKCELSKISRFIDVGSGLGKPNIHVAQYPGVQISIGIELMPIRWKLAMYNLNCLFKATTDNTIQSSSIINEPNINRRINFICNDIDEATTLDPFTHVYMYDLGFPPDLQQSIAIKFNKSTHCKYLISYRPPKRVIDEYLYNVEIIDQIPTSMHGSGEVHTAYFYRRTIEPTEKSTSNCKINFLEDSFNDNSENRITEVECDKLFKSCIELAVGNFHDFYLHVSTIANDHMNDSRSKRERKPRVLY